MRSTSGQRARQPFERDLVPLVGSTAVVPGVLGGDVGDAGLGQAVAQQPVAPVQVVVIVATGIEQDPAQLPKVLVAVVDVDDRIEGEPAGPDLLPDLTARPAPLTRRGAMMSTS